MSYVRLKETWEIVKDLLAEMLFTIDGGSKNWVDNLDGTFTLELCQTYWLELQEDIDINAVIYPISSIVKDTSVTVSGTIFPADNTFSIKAPTWFSGTLRQTNNEISVSTNDISAITPIAYLLRDINDEFQALDSFIERESPIRLFFLQDENFPDFNSETNSIDTLEPLRQMAYYFVEEVLNKSPLIGRIEEDYNIRDYSKFGTEDSNGGVANFFNDQYSAVELNIILPIKSVDCKC
jgi:hypothetical protein